MGLGISSSIYGFYPRNNPSGFVTSGMAVLVYGNQNIDGLKRFNGDVYIKNLYVTGTETITNTIVNNVENPYLLLNLTGGAVDGGIFFVTGTGSTGINDYGPIIGYDSDNKFKFGIGRRSDDLSGLNDIASTQDINNLSGSISTTNLLLYVTKSSGQFTDRPTVNGTGILLSGEAAKLPETIVYSVGDQTISGIKSFVDGTNINQYLNISGTTTIIGHLAASTKSFLIQHPIDSNKKLQYGSLESPYHGIRLTDRAKIVDNSAIVELPKYISSLVNDEKINIQLTNINHSKVLFVKDVNVARNYFVVGTNRRWFDKKEYEFYWSFTAERKDVPQLEVEF
jgi:hypothetical protein